MSSINVNEIKFPLLFELQEQTFMETPAIPTTVAAAVPVINSYAFGGTGGDGDDGGGDAGAGGDAGGGDAG